MPDEPTTGALRPREDLATRVEEIAALDEPARRALYLWGAAQPEPVTRDDAARGAAVPHHVAKFHLDKLVEEGLLEVDASRPPGRGGPGAGRPAKRYRRAPREIAVSLPERDYELAGHLLARAVVDSASTGGDVRDALAAAARDTGHALGRRARDELGRRSGRAALRAATDDVLRDAGYEPHEDDADVVLANCPFHNLAQEFTDLVCGMNLELVDGLVEELGRSDVEAVLDPAPGRCCVRLRARKDGAVNEPR